jgi:hypothetical protein
MDVADRHEPEGVPVRSLHEALVQDDVESSAAHQCARRTGIGIGLVTGADLPERAPLRRAEPPVDLDEEGLDPRGHLGRSAGGERALEVAARHLVGAEPEIEDGELELHAREIGIVEQHPLERADRRLVVAGPGRHFGKAEGQIEVCGLAQDAAEQGLVLRIDAALGASGRAREMQREGRRKHAQQPRKRRSTCAKHAPCQQQLFFFGGQNTQRQCRKSMRGRGKPAL